MKTNKNIETALLFGAFSVIGSEIVKRYILNDKNNKEGGDNGFI